jgi:tripartite-type tricarboxylate transporter receptor subunit TctC
LTAVRAAITLPGLNYALAGGAGRLQHLVIEWFAKFTGIQLVRVPYRGGAPRMKSELISDIADPM